MKIAVIGLGSIGRRHLGNFHTIGGVQLTGWDAAPATREAAAKHFPVRDGHRRRGGGARRCRRRGRGHAARLHLALGRMAAERRAHV